jgi:hypothetical protein
VLFEADTFVACATLGRKREHRMIPRKRFHGKGRIAHFSPPTLQTGAKMVNCYVNFVELLQIKAAIDDAVMHMNPSPQHECSGSCS